MKNELLVKRMIQSVAQRIGELEDQPGSLQDRVCLTAIHDELQTWLDGSREGLPEFDWDLLAEHGIQAPEELVAEKVAAPPPEPSAEPEPEPTAKERAPGEPDSAWRVQLDMAREKVSRYQQYDDAIHDLELLREGVSGDARSQVEAELLGLYRQVQLVSRANEDAQIAIHDLEARRKADTSAIQLTRLRTTINATVPGLGQITSAQLKLRELVDSGVLRLDQETQAQELWDQAEARRIELLNKIGQVATAKYLDDADREVEALQELMDSQIMEFDDETTGQRVKTLEALQQAQLRRSEKRRQKAEDRLNSAKKSLLDGAPRTAINLLHEGLSFLKENDGVTDLMGVADIRDDLDRYLKQAQDEMASYEVAHRLLREADHKGAVDALTLTRQARTACPLYPGIQDLVAERTQAAWQLAKADVQSALDDARRKAAGRNFDLAWAQVHQGRRTAANVNESVALYAELQEKIDQCSREIEAREIFLKAENAAGKLYLLEAETLLDSAEGKVKDISLTSTSSLIAQIVNQRAVITEARELLRDLVEATDYLSRQTRSPGAIHLMSKILKYPDESEPIRAIKRRASRLEIGHILMSGDYDSLERLVTQRIAEDTKDPVAWSYWKWLRSERLFEKTWEETRQQSRSDMERTLEGSRAYNEEVIGDARFWKWLSGFAAVAAFGMLIYAFVFVIQWQEPLSYLSALPAILSGIAAPFIHNHYTSMVDRVNNQGERSLKRIEDHVSEQVRVQQEAFQAILDEIAAPPYAEVQDEQNQG